MTLRGIVIGAGWAGEGYVTALRAAQVDVVVLCGRSPEPAHAMGRRLGIADVQTDWKVAIDHASPDIVVVATPAGPHCEIVEHAAARGAHIICEKPLGRNADEGRRMLAAVETAGVKHAYGATTRYAPGLSEARSLIADGVIGDVQEVEVVTHFGLSPLQPYCWIHSLEHGGGVLANVYTHFLAQTQHVTGGIARWATGHTERVVARVPVGPAVHDFRGWQPLDQAEATAAEWRNNDADFAATVITELELADARRVLTLFRASAFTNARADGYLAIYGTAGTVHLTGFPWHHHLQHFTTEGGHWAQITIAAVNDPIQAGWTHLAADLVADIEGSGGGNGYPTFREGYIANQLIDQVRAAAGAPHDPIGPTTIRGQSP